MEAASTAISATGEVTAGVGGVYIITESSATANRAPGNLSVGKSQTYLVFSLSHSQLAKSAVSLLIFTTVSRITSFTGTVAIGTNPIVIAVCIGRAIVSSSDTHTREYNS